MTHKLGLTFVTGGLFLGLLLSASAVLASAPQKPAEQKTEDGETPEQKMQKRFPQPVKVGFLVGLPVLDDNDSTLGYVTRVVRTGDGKIQLIVPYGGWFGRGGRPVAVPIETVAILARQIAAVDMPREEFDEAETWQEGQGTALAAEETIRIAITRR